MADYLASRIIVGALDYLAVLALYPQFKEGIDAYLRSKGREDLIVE